jgi:hypothetical protein
VDRCHTITASGRIRQRFLPQEHSEAGFELARAVKRAVDPNNIFGIGNGALRRLAARPHLGVLGLHECGGRAGHPPHARDDDLEAEPQGHHREGSAHRLGSEVDTRGEASTGLVARKVRVKNERFKEENIEGIVDGVNHVRFFVDGDEIRLTKGTVPPELRPGMLFKGKGVRQDDRSIELKEGAVTPADFVGEEAQFMAAVSQEIAQVKAQLKTIKDPELQAYVDRVGKSLVPN